MRSVLSPIAAILIATWAAHLSSQAGKAPSAPLDPLTRIIEAFKTNDIVALGEGTHGNEQGHRFRLALLQDRRFAETVNDVVVEFGNSLYQPVMDRFVANGEVPADDLKSVWRNTTQAHFPWDVPIYEEFFRAVRSLNASLAPNRRVRVLLGDPPIDWSQVLNQGDTERWSEQRESYPVDLLKREVLTKHRRALVIYGDGHFFRRSPYGSIVAGVEKGGGKAFAIATITDADLEARQASVSTWPRPSLSMLQGTVLGSLNVTELMPLYRQEWLGHMENQFDALLYLGPRSSITYSRFLLTICADSSDVQLRLNRMALFPVLANEIARLKRLCKLP